MARTSDLTLVTILELTVYPLIAGAIKLPETMTLARLEHQQTITSQSWAQITIRRMNTQLTVPITNFGLKKVIFPHYTLLAKHSQA